MLEAVNWCRDFVQDVNELLSEPMTSKELTELKVKSLFYRTVGAVLTLAAAVTLVSSLATFAVSPISSTIGLASAGLLGTLAHDYITMGNNIRKVTQLSNNSFSNNQGFLKNVFGVGRGFCNLAQAEFYELQSGLPYYFRGTIIFDPLASYLKSEFAVQC